MHKPAVSLSVVAREGTISEPERRETRGLLRSKDQIFSLTGLRFCAAAFVLFGHTVGAFFQPAHVPILEQFFRAGIVGMTLFFVLSGFVIHYNYGRSLSGLRPDAVWRFAVARFARLYPLFFLVVLISIAFAGSVPPVVYHVWPYYLTMTHGWFPFQYVGIDLGDALAPGSWSISVEVCLYLTYVVAFVPACAWLKTSQRILIAITVLAAAASIFHLGHVRGLWWPGDHYWLFYRSPYARLPEFLLGALIAQLYISRSAEEPSALERRLAYIILAGAIVWSFALLGATVMPKWANAATQMQQSWGFAPFAAATIYFAARFDSPVSWFLENKLLVRLGDASYSIYLIHWLFLWYFATSGLGYGWLMAMKIALAYLCVCLFALGIYENFELPARIWLRRLLTYRAAAASFQAMS